jgi:hypothetical protein
MREIAIKVHSIAEDGLPDMEAMTGRVAFVFDGCVVSGWPLPDVAGDGSVWEANSDVGIARPLGGITHWLEFPKPVWEIKRG